MKTHKLLLQGLLALCLALAADSSLWAQATGSMVGNVADKQGAVIPGAKVTVTNLATNEMKVVQSDQSGNFRVVQLQPGNYKVAVEQEGFRQFVQQPVQVAVGNESAVNAAMQVGATTETIEVSTDAPLLSTQSSGLNYGVDSKQVEQLPLNGRNVFNLTELVPGVVPQGATTGQNAATANVTGLGNYQIGGGIANQSAFYIDGAPINVSYVNGAELVPTQEAIDQFQVATNNVSPEYGRFGGGIVNMSTKSGGNQFHGVLYEYNRNAVLNANTFFNKRTNTPRAQYSQNQYGATVGGPVIKDKAFFFLSWEQFDLRQQSTTNDFVPSPAMLTGNFSELLNLGSKSIQLKDPVTGTPFVNNQLPSLNATAKILAPMLWPAPLGVNASRSPAAGQNFTLVTPRTTDYNQYVARGDENIGSKNKLFERYSLWHINSSANAGLGNKTGTRGWHATDQAVLGDTITLSQSLIADVRASFLRFHNVTFPLSCCNFQYSQLGPSWTAYQNQITFPELPQPNVTGLHNFNTTPTIIDTDNAYVLSGNLTQILGRHTFTYGGEMRKIEWDYVQSNNSGTEEDFNGASGYAFADFMLGYVNTSIAAEPALSKGIMWYSGLYFNDSFRWTPKLTINAGVRWEEPGSFTESHGSLTTLLMSLPQPTISTALGKTVTGGLAPINSTAYPHNTWQQLHWNLFSPRVGFAYSATNSTVVSGGFGVSYLPPVVAFSLGPYNNPLNLATTTNSGTAASPLSLSNPFPGSGIFSPPAASGAQAFINNLLGSGIQSPVPVQTYPYDMQWNIGIQKQLGNSGVLRVGYVGARGVHLSLYSLNLDQLPDQYQICGTDKTQPQCNGHLLSDSVLNPMSAANGGPIATTAPLGAKNVPYGYLLKPNPAYQYMTADAPSVGDSSYEALQLMAQKRFKSGSVLTLAYTRATMKGTADVLAPWLEANRNGVGGGLGVQDNTNIKGNATNPGEQSLSSFQTPNRLVVNYVYDLPFGRGQRFGSSVSSLVNGLIGNWEVNGISTFQDGFPLALQDSGYNTIGNYPYTRGFSGPGETQAGVIRPNYTAGCDKNSGVASKPSDRLSKWFNTSCFTQPSTWNFGNEPRVDPNLRSQGIDNTDFSVSKALPFHDRYRVDFRAEVFNFANWTQFSPPNEQPDNSAFGTVTAQYNSPRLIQMSARFTF